MSLNPLAPAFLPHYQSLSDPPLSLCNSTTMNFPLAQLFSGMPPQIIPSHVPSFSQPITDGTFILPLIQAKNPLNKVAAVHQPPRGSSSHLSLSLQHQTNYLQAILHKTIQQFTQHLMAERLDRKTLQLFVPQLQNEFALLRYLLFSPVGTFPISDISVESSATCPLINPNPNLNPTSTAHPLPCVDEPKCCRSTLPGAVGPPRVKTNNSANADYQSSPNTWEAPPTTMQNLTSRICKLEELFGDQMAIFTSITAGIPSQYFFSHDKFRQLEPGNSDDIIWKLPSVKFVFDSAKVARPSSDPSLNRPQRLVVLSSGLIPMDTFFSSNSTPMVLDPLLANVHQFCLQSSMVSTTISLNGPS